MRRNLTFVAAAFILIMATAVLENLGCREPFDIVVRVVPTGNRVQPYAATGSIVGCGVRRFAGRDRFYLALSPDGGESLSITRSGNRVVEIRVALSNDSKTARYHITIKRGAERMTSKSGVLPLPVKG